MTTVDKRVSDCFMLSSSATRKRLSARLERTTSNPPAVEPSIASLARSPSVTKRLIDAFQRPRSNSRPQSKSISSTTSTSISFYKRLSLDSFSTCSARSICKATPASPVDVTESMQPSTSRTNASKNANTEAQKNHGFVGLPEFDFEKTETEAEAGAGAITSTLVPSSESSAAEVEAQEAAICRERRRSAPPISLDRYPKLCRSVGLQPSTSPPGNPWNQEEVAKKKLVRQETEFLSKATFQSTTPPKVDFSAPTSTTDTVINPKAKRRSFRTMWSGPKGDVAMTMNGSVTNVLSEPVTVHAHPLTRQAVTSLFRSNSKHAEATSTSSKDSKFSSVSSLPSLELASHSASSSSASSTPSVQVLLTNINYLDFRRLQSLVRRIDRRLAQQSLLFQELSTNLVLQANQKIHHLMHIQHQFRLARRPAPEKFASMLQICQHVRNNVSAVLVRKTDVLQQCLACLESTKMEMLKAKMRYARRHVTAEEKRRRKQRPKSSSSSSTMLSSWSPPQPVANDSVDEGQVFHVETKKIRKMHVRLEDDIALQRSLDDDIYKAVHRLWEDLNFWSNRRDRMAMTQFGIFLEGALVKNERNYGQLVVLYAALRDVPGVAGM